MSIHYQIDTSKDPSLFPEMHGPIGGSGWGSRDGHSSLGQHGQQPGDFPDHNLLRMNSVEFSPRRRVHGQHGQQPGDFSAHNLLRMNSVEFSPRRRVVRKRVQKRFKRARMKMMGVLPMMRARKSNQEPEPPRVVMTTKTLRKNQWARLRMRKNSIASMTMHQKAAFAQGQRYLEEAERNGVRTELLLTRDKDGEVVKQKSLEAIHDGDRQFYNRENLAVRRLLKRSQGIIDAVKKLWEDIAILRTEYGLLEKSGYVLLFSTVTRVYVPDMSNKELKRSVEKDWETDSKGHVGINFQDFYDCIFQMVDTWVDSVKEEDYIKFIKYVAGLMKTYCKMHLRKGMLKRGMKWLRKSRLSPSAAERAAEAAKHRAEEEAAKEREAEARAKAKALGAKRAIYLQRLRAQRARERGEVKVAPPHHMWSTSREDREGPRVHLTGLPSSIGGGTDMIAAKEDHFFGEGTAVCALTPRIDANPFIEEHPWLNKAMAEFREGHGVPLGQALLRICLELQAAFGGGVSIYDVCDFIINCAFDWSRVLAHLEALSGGETYARGLYILKMQREDVDKKALRLWEALSAEEKTQISMEELQALVRSQGGDLSRASELLCDRRGVRYVVEHHLRGWLTSAQKAMPISVAPPEKKDEDPAEENDGRTVDYFMAEEKARQAKENSQPEDSSPAVDNDEAEAAPAQKRRLSRSKNRKSLGRTRRSRGLMGPGLDPDDDNEAETDATEDAIPKRGITRAITLTSYDSGTSDTEEPPPPNYALTPEDDGMALGDEGDIGLPVIAIKEHHELESSLRDGSDSDEDISDVYMSFKTAREQSLRSTTTSTSSDGGRRKKRGELMSLKRHGSEADHSLLGHTLRVSPIKPKRRQSVFDPDPETDLDATPTLPNDHQPPQPPSPDATQQANQSDMSVSLPATPGSHRTPADTLNGSQRTSADTLDGSHRTSADTLNGSHRTTQDTLDSSYRTTQDTLGCTKGQQKQHRKYHKHRIAPMRRRRRPDNGKGIHLRPAPRVKEDLKYERLSYPLTMKMGGLSGTHKTGLAKHAYPAGFEAKTIRDLDPNSSKRRYYYAFGKNQIGLVE